jgi:3-oxoacyl-[acyl-carrier-protein] synthase III
MTVRIASAAYAVPREIESVEAIMVREHSRVEAALAPLNPRARHKAVEGLGLSQVRVCGSQQPFDLVLEAALAALREADVSPQALDLILDFSTFPGENSQHVAFAHKLSSQLGAENSLNISFKAGGCAGIHLAIKTALALMNTDQRMQTALLVTGDTPPKDNRSLMPITVQGDAGSAIVLRRQSSGSETAGLELLGVEVMTLGHLYDAISLVRTNGHLEIAVDALRIQDAVMPIYYLNLFHLVETALASASLRLEQIDHFIYSNISQRDRDGFRRMLGLPPNRMPVTPMAEYGHTFASDLIINYETLRRQGSIKPGQLLLFASAGIGFTWGVTLARA